MRRGFHFANEDALRAALLAGLVPPSLASAGAKVVRLGKELWIYPENTIDKVIKKQLAAAGAPFRTRKHRKHKGKSQSVCCWAEILNAHQKEEIDPDSGPILFMLPTESSLLDIAGELLRLGCIQQSFTVADSGRYLIRAMAPPYYTLTRAFDEAEGLRAFRPMLQGQEQIWIELGCSHPCGKHLITPPDSIVLITRIPPWIRFARLQWQELEQVIDFIVPAVEPLHHVPVISERLRVPLCLLPGATEASSLWIIRERAVEKMESLVRSLPQEAMTSLLFTVVKAGNSPTVLLKARPGFPSSFEIQGEVYAAHNQLRHLFLPEGFILEPPLQRNQLRQLLAPHHEQLVWLRRINEIGSFQPESINESAFEPLENWVEYIVGSATQVLEPWIHSTLFELEPFELDRTEITSSHMVEEQKPIPEQNISNNTKLWSFIKKAVLHKKIKKGGKEDQIEFINLNILNTSQKQEKSDPEAKKRAPLLEKLSRLETEFLALELPGDAPERNLLWLQLAQVNTELKRLDEAGLCWVRALWELTDAEAVQLAQKWAAAEAQSTGHSETNIIPQLLKKQQPDRNDTRTLASQLIAGAMNSTVVPTAELTRWQQWFARHEANLDLRSWWLGQLALSQLAGGDPLGLARCRDRLLAKLHHGLSPNRELPSFLRLSHVDLHSSGAEQIAGVLNALLERAQRRKREASSEHSDAVSRFTWAYVHFLFAFGMARLGQAEQARALAEKANNSLELSDPIHGFLVRAYNERIEHAVTGLPPETPLSSEVVTEFNKLERFPQYKINCLREASKILEPQRRFDPTQSFQREAQDPQGDVFCKLKDITDQNELATEVEILWNHASAASTSLEERAHLYDGILDFFPLLAESQVLPHLSNIIPNTQGIDLRQRSQLFGTSLILAGHLGQEELVEQFVKALKPLLLSGLETDPAVVVDILDDTLRTIRRVGLREKAGDLLESLTQHAKGPDLLIVRVQLGAAQAYLGHPELAKPSHQEAFDTLRGELRIHERLQLCRALAQALAVSPREYALKELARLEEEQLAKVTDSFSTKSHFSLSIISFMESLVLGYVSDQLTLSEQTRQWLDEEEYLIRRRIHRDLENIKNV